MFDITLIGCTCIDVLAQPVNAEIFTQEVNLTEFTGMLTGGDAMNEAVVLSRLGKRVNLISRVGNDVAGDVILQQCRKNGISTKHISVREDVATSIVLVMVDHRGERSFVIGPNTSTRTFSPEDIPEAALGQTKIVSFASMFISPRFQTGEMAQLFAAAKEKNCIVCADVTRRKGDETVEKLAPALRYVDYIFPNYAEACELTGKTDVEEAADAFLKAGVGCAVIKLGKEGCFLKSESRRMRIPGYPVKRCVDTTGAGDNFVAGFLYALSEGYSLYECGRLGNAAASIAVEHVGANEGVQSLQQVMERYKS